VQSHKTCFSNSTPSIY